MVPLRGQRARATPGRAAEAHGRAAACYGEPVEARELHRVTVEEYIALDRSSDVRWEYVDGRAMAMAGASPRHNAIVMNLALALGNALRGKSCFPLGSDQKIETVATTSFHYPDLSIVCGKPRPSERDPHAITNPTVIVEVASPSTSDYDRGAKFDHYATIPELRELLVVFTDTRRVEHRERAGDGRWMVTHLVGGQLRLESIDVSLSFEEIYADLERVEV